jgi:hypothetical protein
MPEIVYYKPNGRGEWERIDKVIATPEERIADSLEEIGKKLSHIEDWLGELVTYLKRK